MMYMRKVFKRSALFFVYVIALSGVSYANMCPLQDFKQYAKKLDKTQIEFVDRLKEYYENIASKQSEQCRSLLFRDLRNYHSQAIREYAESAEEKLNAIGYFDSPKEEKEYRAKLYKVGLGWQQDEGYYYVITNSTWYLNEFGTFLPDYWKKFLKQGANEEVNRYMDDAALMITWEEVRNRVVFWENFVEDYPYFSEKSIAEENLSLYLTVYLKGTDNSPIYAYDTKKIFPEVKKSYENFIKHNTLSKYYEVVKSQYNIIKEHAFVIDEKVSKKLDDNYKKSIEKSKKKAIEVRLPYSEDYHISEQFKGEPASVNLSSHPKARTYRTRLQYGAKQGSNFSGHYTVVEWGCGSGCSTFAIVDARSGQVFFLDDLSAVGFPFLPQTEGKRLMDRYDVIYHVESTLLIVHGIPSTKKKLGSYYYNFKDGHLKLIAVYGWESKGNWETCKNGEAKGCYTHGAIYALEYSKRYDSENHRHYPFICYREKSKNSSGKIIYNECIRSDVKCSSVKKAHFGAYPNDLKAHEAFKRCTEGSPRSVDPQ